MKVLQILRVSDAPVWRKRHPDRRGYVRPPVEIIEVPVPPKPRHRASSCDRCQEYRAEQEWIREMRKLLDEAVPIVLIKGVYVPATQPLTSREYWAARSREDRRRHRSKPPVQPVVVRSGVVRLPSGEVWDSKKWGDAR